MFRKLYNSVKQYFANLKKKKQLKKKLEDINNDDPFIYK
tara:strand:- start:7495 stop:7611 length:117 start_codon:yes stop_codon:yes gene_type:complete